MLCPWTHIELELKLDQWRLCLNTLTLIILALVDTLRMPIILLKDKKLEKSECQRWV